MSNWGWWLIAAGGLAALEVATTTLVFAMLAIAALVGSLVAVSGGSAPLQVWVALIAVLPLNLLVRPRAMKYWHRSTPDIVTGLAGYVGREAIVNEAISPKAPGQVTLHGELWPAISDLEIEVGATVVITAIKAPNLIVTVH